MVVGVVALGFACLQSPAGAQEASGLDVTVRLNSFGMGGGGSCGFRADIDVVVDNGTGAPVTVTAVRYSVIWRYGSWVPTPPDEHEAIGSWVSSSGGLEAGTIIPEGRTTFAGIVFTGGLGSAGGCQPTLRIKVVLETSAGTAVGEVPFPSQTVPVLPLGALGLSALLLPAVVWGKRARR